MKPKEESREEEHGTRGRDGLLVSIVAAWFIPILACTATDVNWRFAVVGDSRGEITTGVNDAVLSELVCEILARDVDFVLFPGDLVYGAGVSASEFENQLRHWVGVMQPLYDAGIAVYACRGNHEIGDMWYALPDKLPSPLDNYGKRWLRVFGSDADPQHKLPDNGPDGEKSMTYSVVHKNALIVGMDEYGGTAYWEAHYVNQEWLDRLLEDNVKPHVFAFGHEPAFRMYHSDCLDAHPDRRDTMWLSLKTAGGRTYFCCHDHFYDHASVDDGDGNPDNDVHQFVAATAGAPFYTWEPPYDGNNGGFAVKQVYHAENHYGYVLVDVNDLDMTLAWMQRQGADLTAPAIYEAKDVWRYKVSPNLVVLRPATGERVLAGQPYAIRWKATEGTHAGRLLVEYSIDDGINWAAIGQSDDTGTYDWSVPVVNSDSCLVRITSIGNPKISAATDGRFSVLPSPTKSTADPNCSCGFEQADAASPAGE
jgi:hypothetical protein